MPSTHSLDRIVSDFAQMKSIIYGEIPLLEELIGVIERLENEINEKQSIHLVTFSLPNA